MDRVIEIADVPMKKGWKTLRQRFWEKVDKSHRCWIWTAATNSGRYGSFMVVGGNPPKMKAHRVAWLLTYGEIPKGKVVCHLCDNVMCVRPDHLTVATQAENLRDMFLKGRNPNRKVPHKRNRQASPISPAVRGIYEQLVSEAVETSQILTR